MLLLVCRLPKQITGESNRAGNARKNQRNFRAESRPRPESVRAATERQRRRRRRRQAFLRFKTRRDRFLFAEQVSPLSWWRRRFEATERRVGGQREHQSEVKKK